MLKVFEGKEEQQRILILNYNTILLQSVGFLNFMKNKHGIDNPFSKYEDTEYIVNVLQFANKNTARIIDKTIDEEFYFSFIKANFKEITDESPIAYLQYYLNILLGQSFIKEIHIASPVSINVQEVFPEIKEPLFDIFDVNQVVRYINENQMTCLFLHDIEMMKNIVEHPEMDSRLFTYLLSKIGYNYQEEDEALFLKIPEIMDLRDEKQFLFGIVNLLSTDESDNIIF